MRVGPRFFPMWLGPGTHRVCDQAHNAMHAALIKDNARIQMIKAPMAIYCVGHRANTGHGEHLGSLSYPGLAHPLGMARSFAKHIIRRKRLTPALRKEFLIPDCVEADGK